MTPDRDYELEEVLETYRRDGSMIREKSRVLVEEWLDKLYPRMIDPDISTSALLEVGKVLIELGDLKPKKDMGPAQVGPNFSISINIPQANGAEPIVITGEALPVESADPEESSETPYCDDLDALPAPEMNWNLPFDINKELITGVAPTEADKPRTP